MIFLILLLVIIIVSILCTHYGLGMISTVIIANIIVGLIAYFAFGIPPY